MQANEVMAARLRAGRPDHRRHQPRPGLPRRVGHEPEAGPGRSPSCSGPARPALVLRGLLGSVRLVAGAVPKLPSALLAMASEKLPDLVNMGALTIISNIYGNPAVSIPAGTVDGLPVGMQVLAAHHRDALLFDVALSVERERPWPMVAPAVRRSVRADGPQGGGRGCRAHRHALAEGRARAAARRALPPHGRGVPVRRAEGGLGPRRCTASRSTGTSCSPTSSPSSTGPARRSGASWPTPTPTPRCCCRSRPADDWYRSASNTIFVGIQDWAERAIHG